jgi:hypothetical protein
MQITGIEHIVVNDAEAASPSAANAGAGEILQNGTAKAAGADHEHPRRG